MPSNLTKMCSLSYAITLTKPAPVPLAFFSLQDEEKVKQAIIGGTDAR